MGDRGRHDKEIAGVGRRSMALLYCDTCTGHLYSYSCSNRDEGNVEWALMTNMGLGTMKHLYTETATEFRSACRTRKVAWEGSDPGRHPSNAIIEQVSGEVLNRIRVLLAQAGMPACL